jgi:hypothetical protein
VTLRLGIDLDGTVADLSAKYHEFEDAIFGEHLDDETAEQTEMSEELTDKEKLMAAKAATVRRDTVWRAIRSVENFWETLEPIEPGALRAVYEATIASKWEVFFVTQRPTTAGDSVQLQSQRWLIANGFESPSVLTLTGSRGKAAHSLELDFLIDDLPKNCIDTISDSRCRPLLVLRSENPDAMAAAKRLDIGVVGSVVEAINLLRTPRLETKQSIVHYVLKRLGLAR